MTTLAHDGAASLRVANRIEALRYDSGAIAETWIGWYVVRTCSCHSGERIAGPYDSRERAEHALAFLDSDARRYAA